MAYDSRVERTGTSRTAREVPETVAAGILADAVEGSAALALGNVFRMPAYQHRIRVLKAFADAYWLDGVSQAAKDSALKQTTKVEWDNVYLTPEEIAVLVPIPDAWMADSDIAWGEIRREVARAFARKIDEAIFFGAGGVPTTFGDGVVPEAIAAGNTVELGSTEITTFGGTTGNDFAADYAALAQLLGDQGYVVDGAVAGPGFRWRLVNMRTADGAPIYASVSGGRPGEGTLYGERFQEVRNGSWDNDEAITLTGEFDKLVIGVRQDMTFSLHTDGIIQNADGDIVYNAMQQDGKILRAVMRLGYAVPNPVKVLGGEYPFGVITPAVVSS